MSQEKPGFSTLCVHGGEDLDAQGGIHVPLYNHSTFGFPSTQALLDVVEGRKEGNLYTRYGLNPTIRAVERKLALLEGVNGLPDFPGHAVAARQMLGFGGMVSFVYDGDATCTAAVVDRLRIFTIAASLGGAESLVTQPITTTHHGMTPQERSRRGIVDGMVRLSCGLEDTKDLVSDLEQALNG